MKCGSLGATKKVRGLLRTDSYSSLLRLTCSKQLSFPHSQMKLSG